MPLWENTTRETALTLQISANTILLAGKQMAGNILANTPEIIRAPGVKKLFNRLATFLQSLWGQDLPLTKM